MPTVRFAWNPQLVDVRRTACPKARWDKAARAWSMTDAEVHVFIEASHQKLDYARIHTEIHVDDDRWLIGFVQGAPAVVR